MSILSNKKKIQVEANIIVSSDELLLQHFSTILWYEVCLHVRMKTLALAQCHNVVIFCWFKSNLNIVFSASGIFSVNSRLVSISGQCTVRICEVVQIMLIGTNWYFFFSCRFPLLLKLCPLSISYYHIFYIVHTQKVVMVIC